MVAYTGTPIFEQALGSVGVPTLVAVKFNFTAATLTTADTFTVDAFAQNGIEVPVQTLQMWLTTTAASPTGLAMQVGNADAPDGFLVPTAFTAGQVNNRLGLGSLIGKPIRKRAVTMNVTTNASAAYTGDIVLSFLTVLNRN
jgi:hypothetical protein